MEVVACIPYYNEAVLIRGCLHSIDGRVDRILLLDGAWRGFPRRKRDHQSTDGTIEIIRTYKFHQNIENMIGHPPWVSNMHKRNRFFQLCNEGDILFFLDANEAVFGGLPLDVGSLDPRDRAWKTKMWAFDEVTAKRPVRLIRNKKGIHFAENHFMLRYGNGAPLREKNIGKVQIVTHDIGHLRPKWRLDLRDEYRREALGRDEKR